MTKLSLPASCLRFSALANVTVSSFLLVFLSLSAAAQQPARVLHNPTSGDPVPKLLLLRIVRAEDERRWDTDLRDLFRARNANVRARAALAAGRIGDEAAIADLVTLLRNDDEAEVRAMAAFALGEIESPLAADALIGSLTTTTDDQVRGRAFEALGKIAVALPKEQEAKSKELGGEILKEFKSYISRRATPDVHVVLLGLTAILRARPEQAGPVVAQFLTHTSARVRADAANTLARLKLKDGNELLRKLLVSDPDPIVRANAARVLGATEDKSSADALLGTAISDRDLRVRVSSLRALGLLKQTQPADALRNRLNVLCSHYSVESDNRNEILEIATTLGRILQGKPNKDSVAALKSARTLLGSSFPEIEVALAQISPADYLEIVRDGSDAEKNAQRTMLLSWKNAAALAQGLGAIATSGNAGEKEKAERILRAMTDYRDSGLVINTLVAVHSEYALPDVLRGFAAFKSKDLADVLHKQMKESDVVARATAADLLGELEPSEANETALIDALPVALADRELNDAALSILDALAKQKNARANDAIKSAMDSKDHLIRRRAVALLKMNGAGDFHDRIGTVETRNTGADYDRAIARIGRQVRATVNTTKGAFTIDLLPEAAPLTVDNFVQLAKRKYFNSLSVHRVVPNFVIQDGDPRGDGNGGPGYQIRCEINEVPYDRGAVGMALSGKDTGGSQWFVTHSPQPHLDGGYTVFGNVISGMDVVDSIARGDVIKSITVSEKRSQH
ncbi:MAG TPA: peptidylprolyl isomerase [Pyrinomonadaceae bacterium]|nr:peptidylprolyl isomerase [Pyrinomonadaceae bacterium]